MAGKFALVLKSLHFIVQFDYNGLKKTLIMELSHTPSV